jgi:hypothetical protein
LGKNLYVCNHLIVVPRSVHTWRDLTSPRVKAILALPDNFTVRDLKRPPFRLHRATVGALHIEVFHAPFGYVNQNAKIVLVGITPGPTQMETAYRSARLALKQGFSPKVASWFAKQRGSFAGPIRTNLIAMLDGIGLPKITGIRSSAELFGDRADLLHATSVLSCPVFVADRPYTGHHPRLLDTPLFIHVARVVLVSELREVSNGLIIPCGQAVTEVLRLLIDERQLDADRCLLDFPHPSGANGHRQQLYRRVRPGLARQVRAWFR